MSEITIESNRANKSLEEKDDYLGTIPKAKAIQGFLEGGNINFEENQMFALFGNWGSGKTTLFHYLENNLDKKKFKPVFFEAWKYETDENLPLSLMEMISKEMKWFSKSKDTASKLFGLGLDILKGFAKSTTFRIADPNLPISASYSPKETINALEEGLEEFENNSLAHRTQEFEIAFKQLEEDTLENNQTLIVFIDDLDRCEPENVIKLLSAIKLFFTYGKRTIFFFGVDKKAVEQAIEIKYKDVVKSAEYLEKIFDFSFEAPKGFDLYKLMQRHFPTEHSSEMDIAQEVTSLFNHMKFTNPRKVKKVLNKYTLLKSYKHNEQLDESLKELIPEIITNQEDGNLLETAISLYLIVLYEFDYELFEQSEGYLKKATIYGVNFVRKEKEAIRPSEIDRVNDIFNYRDSTTVQFNQIYDSILSSNNRNEIINSYLTQYLPTPVAPMSISSRNPSDFLISYKRNTKSDGFINYIVPLFASFTNSNNLSEMRANELFKMVRTVL